MKRREFIASLAGTAAASALWPITADAQQPDRMRRIGMLQSVAESDPERQACVAAFREGLRKLGWVEGRNIRIDQRWAAGDADRLRIYAAELTRMTPDVILAGGISALATLQQATHTVPIVFAHASDPVAAGFLTNLARPGGNMTGFVIFEQATGVKWLELLKQIAPRITRVGFIYDPANPTWPDYLRAIEAGAPSLGVSVSGSAVRNAVEIEHAIEVFAREPNSGLIVGPTPAINFHAEQIIALTARHNLPAVYRDRMFVKGGALASYGVDIVDQCRGAAGYIDRILKGEKPGDLPVQLPTRFELVINLKTAKALGLELPLALLIRADELIE